MPLSLIHPDERFHNRFRYVLTAQRVRPWLALTTLFLAVIGLLENFLGLDIFLRPSRDAAATHPATAICLVVMSIGVLSYRVYKPTPTWRYAISGTCLTFLLVVLTTRGWAWLTQGDTTSAMDQGDPSWGAMGTDTALVLALLFASAILRRHTRHAGLFMGLAAATLVVASFIGLSYGKNMLEGQMAASTLVALVPASIMILSLYAHRPIVRVALISGPGGMRTRLMMVVGFIVPWAGGLVLHRVFGVPDRAVPVEAILVGVIIFCTSAVAVISGLLNERVDHSRRRLSRELARMAVEDQLTGTLNRAGIGRELRDRWWRFERGAAGQCVILMDLDHFKKINDESGHDEGDRVLSDLGRRLRPHLRSTDAIGRWGGEEFLILIDDATHNEAADLAERLRRAVAETPTMTSPSGDIVSRARDVTASFGVAFFEPGEQGHDEAVKRADMALYAAKTAGRNQVVISGKAPERAA